MVLVNKMIVLNNGVKMPRLGLGVFLSEAGYETQNAVLMALEAGYRHVDTAAVYGNEKDVGLAVKASGLKREEVFITSKLSTFDMEDHKSREGVLKSLDNLDIEYIDLYLVHWAATNYREGWEELISFYEEGLLRSIGVSNFQTHHLHEIEGVGPVPATNEIELHPYFQQRELKKYCEDKGIIIEAWAPLGGVDHLCIDEPIIQNIAEKHGKTGAQVAIRWHLQTGNIVIPKSVRRERIIENSQVFDFSLDDKDMSAIAAMDENKRLYWDPMRWD